MGSLRTFEMNLKVKSPEKKKKCVGWKADEDISDQIAFLAKNFSKFIKKIDPRNNDKGQQSTSNMQNRRGNNFQYRKKEAITSNIEKKNLIIARIIVMRNLKKSNLKKLVVLA